MANRDYNGVTLPELPAVDRTKYPYTYIENLVSFYNLQFSTQPLYYQIDDAEKGYDSVYHPVGTEILNYGVMASSEEWMELNTETVTEDTPAFNPDVIIWSDHDIINSDTGEIYFYGEKAEDKDYLIKQSTLNAIGDQVRRISGTADKLSTSKMLEIFGNVLSVEGVKF